MNEFLLVLAIAGVAAFLTYLGAPVAERYEIPHRAVAAALQFAAGIITGLVALSLMPPAVREGAPVSVAVAFFVGGALYVVFEYISARRLAARPPTDSSVTSLGLYIGILVDLIIDGIVIGIGSTLTLTTGLLLALGMAVSTAPLAFVTIATAKRQGMSLSRRRQLAWAMPLCLVGGAAVGYLVLRDASLTVRLTLIAMASGFLITTVTQSMIPEANKEGEPSFAGILYLAGLSVFALLSGLIK